MKTITIGFSKPLHNRPLSSLIVWMQGSIYSHVYIKFYSSTYDRHLIYQASGTEVNFIEYGHFLLKNEVIEEFDFTIDDETYVETIQFAIDNAGIPYGLRQLIGLGIKTLAKACFNKNIPNPFRDGMQSYVCCELAGYIVKYFIDASLITNLDDMDLKDLYNHISMIHSSIK